MRTILIALALGVAGCTSKSPKDKLQDAEFERMARDSVKAHLDRIRKDVNWDTVGVWNAPVKVLSFAPVQKEYSSYRDLSLSYKNVSGKTITAIRFRWYGVTAFNEPADMGVINDGFGAGFTDETLYPSAVGYGTWSVLSKNLKKVIYAWPVQVAFSDGTTWKSTNRK